MPRPVTAKNPNHELRKARRAAGQSQEQAAAWVGVDPRTWRRWERGEHPCPLAVLRVYGLAK